MTLETQNSYIYHKGDGSQTVFSYNFRVDQQSHLRVYLGGILQTTGYTVTGIGDDTGGNVTFTTAPGNNIDVGLVRNVPLTQDVDYRPYDAFPAETHEFALDRLTMMTQQQQEELSRTVKFPEGQPPDFDAIFPDYDPGKAIQWSATINQLENSRRPMEEMIQEAEAAATAAQNAQAGSESARDQSVTARDQSREARDKAQQWAELPVDQQVETDKFSSLHWADKSNKWAETAADTQVESGQYSALHWSTVASRWADRAVDQEVVTGRYSARHWSEIAKRWAERDVGSPVEGNQYSAKHWADKASKWSDTVEDTAVETGRFSARHWSEKSRKWSETAYGTEVTTGSYSSLHHAEQSRRWSETAPGTPVSGTEYSARHWSDKASQWAQTAPDTEVETGQYSSRHWSNVSSKWAQNPVGQVVANGGLSALHHSDKASQWADKEPGQEVENGRYSARHWADQASKIGLTSLTTGDTETLTTSVSGQVGTVTAKTNIASGLVKLDAQGLIPPNLLPITGITILGFISAADTCPKPNQETTCTVPDQRNPSQVYPSITYQHGTGYIISEAGDMNIKNNDGVDTVTALVVGDFIIYLTTADGAIATGWYRIPDFVGSQIVSAVNTTFDDSSTRIKGINVQVWNQNIDTDLTSVKANADGALQRSGGTMTGQIVGISPAAAGDLTRKDYVDGKTDNKLPLAGGRMTGNLELANNVALRALNNGGASQRLAIMDSNNNVSFGNATYPTYLHGGDNLYLRTQNITRVTVSTNQIVSSLPVIGVTPTQDNHLTRKDYVDQQVATRLPLSGGTVTGAISGVTPTAAAHLTRKDYVDAQVGTRLPLAGGDMTGNINLNNSVRLRGRTTTNAVVDIAFINDANTIIVGSNDAGHTASVSLRRAGQEQIQFNTAGDIRVRRYIACEGGAASSLAPTSVQHLTRKDYVDQQVATRLPLAGGTMTGVLLLNNSIRLNVITSAGAALARSAVYGAPSADTVVFGSNACRSQLHGLSGSIYGGSGNTVILNWSGNNVNFPQTVSATNAPTAANHLARKDYVDQQVATRLPLAGGTLTGAVSGVAPTAAAHLTRKDYVDTADTNLSNRITTNTTNITNNSSVIANHGQRIAALESQPAGGNPPGTIIAFAGAPSSPPDGYLYCNGQSVSRTTYAALFNAIGTIYGSASGTTFNVPDLRGEFLRGQNDGTGNDPNAAQRTDRGDGTAGDNVGTKQGTETAPHTHGTNTTGNHGHRAYVGGTLGFGSPGMPNVSGGSWNAFALQNAGNHAHTVTANTGSESRPRNVYVRYYIKT